MFENVLELKNERLSVLLSNIERLLKPIGGTVCNNAIELGREDAGWGEDVVLGSVCICFGDGDSLCSTTAVLTGGGDGSDGKHSVVGTSLLLLSGGCSCL